MPAAPTEAQKREFAAGAMRWLDSLPDDQQDEAERLLYAALDESKDPATGDMDLALALKVAQDAFSTKEVVDDQGKG